MPDGVKKRKKKHYDSIHKNSIDVETEIGWSITEDENGGTYLDGSFEVVSLEKSLEPTSPSKSVRRSIDTKIYLSPPKE